MCLIRNKKQMRIEYTRDCTNFMTAHTDSIGWVAAASGGRVEAVHKMRRNKFGAERARATCPWQFMAKGNLATRATRKEDMENEEDGDGGTTTGNG